MSKFLQKLRQEKPPKQIQNAPQQQVQYSPSEQILAEAYRRIKARCPEPISDFFDWAEGRWGKVLELEDEITAATKARDMERFKKDVEAWEQEQYKLYDEYLLHCTGKEMFG